MKCGIATVALALNTRTDALLLANIACEAPSGGRNGFDRIDWLEKNGVGKEHLGYPQRTHHVSPLIFVRLLECTASIRTQYAVDWTTWALQTTATKPLTLGNVRNAYDAENKNKYSVISFIKVLR